MATPGPTSGMSYDAAMLLKESVDRELRALTAIESAERAKEYPWFGWSLPHLDTVYVVTQNGEHFGVMTFSGEYSEYHETVHWSEAEWATSMVGWRQAFFNPDGEWTQRLVLAVDPPPRSPGQCAARLECGHGRNPENAVPGRAAQVGDRIACWRCQEEGIGLTDDLVQEGIEKALATHTAG